MFHGAGEPADVDARLRKSAMEWLDEQGRQGRELLSFDQLAQFRFDGQRISLMDRQRGIRKPAILDAALSFRTTHTPPGRVPPYEDAQGPDGLLRYKYRGTDPEHPENVALRRAKERRLPLIWFYGIASGRYLPRYPVWLVDDEPAQLQFVVALDGAQLLIPRPTGGLDAESRRYVERLSAQRLHQPVFRARVLHAYQQRCAICRLRHVELLDAAHILPDGHPQGRPVVPNGPEPVLTVMPCCATRQHPPRGAGDLTDMSNIGFGRRPCEPAPARRSRRTAL